MCYNKAMTTSAKAKHSATKSPKIIGETPDIERFLVENHKEVAAKLEDARTSIARGEAEPLEPLPVLLRDARRHYKATR